jgi:hypothetical protein
VLADWGQRGSLRRFLDPALGDEGQERPVEVEAL